MEEKVWTKKKIILIIGFGLLAVILLLIRFLGGTKEENKIEKVKSSSKFYTVSNCVSRYLNYIYSEDVDSLILLLDKSYKKNNNISKNNLLDKIGKLDALYSFEGRKMYQQVINDNITKYYVKGYLIQEVMSDDLLQDKKDFYIIVYLDTKNSTYSILPYDGELFINGGIE